jgi:hypothetical protein
MMNRLKFLTELELLGVTNAERAIALLWYYHRNQEFDERSVYELANDLHDEGYSKPNTTRLKKAFNSSKYVTKGKRESIYQINIRYLHELDKKYEKFLTERIIEVSDNIIPFEWVEGTRRYLEALSKQINGTYDYGFYDACATLCRRLMESLIIEVYIHKKQQGSIQNQKVFLPLDNLIKIITTDKSIVLSRSTPATMKNIKDIGNFAAHDRTYITRHDDISKLITPYRRLVRELLELSGIIN